MTQPNVFVQSDSAIVIAGIANPTVTLIELAWFNDERGIGYLPISIKQIDNRTGVELDLSPMYEKNQKYGKTLNAIITNSGYTFEFANSPIAG